MNDNLTRPSSLYRKTLILLLGLTVVVAVADGVIGRRWLVRQAFDQLAESVLSVARLMEPKATDVLLRTPTVEIVQPLAQTLGRQARCQVTIIDPHGIVLGDSEQPMATVRLARSHGEQPEVRAALSGRIGTTLRRNATSDQRVLSVALPLKTTDRLLGVLCVAAPLTLAASVRHEIYWVAILAVIIGTVAAVAFGTWLIRRITGPLTHITAVAKAYAEGDFNATVEDAPIREIEELTGTMNRMRAAIIEQINALTNERNQATAIVGSMTEGVIAVDAQGQILLANPAARVLLGFSGPSVIGQGLFEAVRMHEVQAVVRAVLEERRHSTQDIRLFHPQERILRVHGVPCEGAGVSGPAVVLVIQDTTEHRRYEELRREFVANVSHELKSPLTSIRSLTETLLHGALEDAVNNRRFVELIDGDAVRLTRLIDDLLALSEIESQAVPLNVTAVELVPLVKSVVETLQPGIDQRRLMVHVDLPQRIIVNADPDRLRQVLINLVDNAVKYNREAGRVMISAESINGWLKVSVADSGIGIPVQDLPRIFERFYRVDKARSRDLGGTGLGLSIVKHIVEAHGGRVSVASVLNQGSTFTFTIPVPS